MSLTLRQIRYFVATAEIGQISQAAIHLNISQSAVTTAIKELEAMLGAQLFVRSAQGMSLTDAGRHFLNRAYVIVRSVDDALNSPLPDYRASGVLRVAASYTVLGYFLPHHLQRMEHWHPDVTIEVFEQERQAIEHGLLNGQFDMAVVLTANLTHADIVSEILFNSERRLWLPSHHPLCERPAVSSPMWPGSRTFSSPSTKPNKAPCATGNRPGKSPRCGCAPVRWRQYAAWSPTAAAWRSCQTWCIARGHWKANASKP